MIRQSKVDKLVLSIYPDRLSMGKAAAEIVYSKMISLLNQQPFINMIFAAAPSQNEFLAALVSKKDIDWQRVNAFHMDEYIGLADDARQRFGTFLKEKIFRLLPFRSVNYIDGNAADSEAECRRYAELLAQNLPDIVCMGIGENGHIAFNDPHVADFNDPLLVKNVELDQQCRQQQVNDGCFENLTQVPKQAITLTVPALMAGKYIYCIVPGRNKAKAVYDTLKGEIGEQCPASVLRTRSDTVLFLDEDSSGQLMGQDI